MIRLLALVGRHSRAMKLGSIALAFVLLGGGLALGMSSASGSPAPPALTAPEPVSRVTQPSRHYLVGTVFQTVAPGRVIVRGSGGRFFVVEYDRSTVVRRDRQRAGLQALRRGTRVIILGSPRDGRFHADIVTITGTVPARQVPVDRPAVTPTPQLAPAKPTAVLPGR